MRIVLSALAATALISGFAQAETVLAPTPAPLAAEIFSPEAPLSNEVQPAQIQPIQVESAPIESLQPAPAPASSAGLVPAPDAAPAPAPTAEVAPAPQPTATEASVPATARTTAIPAPAPEAGSTVGANYTFSLE